MPAGFVIGFSLVRRAPASLFFMLIDRGDKRPPGSFQEKQSRTIRTDYKDGFMKTLWTPWRMEHVLGSSPKTGHCLFEPDTGATADKNLLLLYRDKLSLVLLNRFPYANGHLLVAPIRHVSCITELSAEENSVLTESVKKATSILQKHLKPDGFNIGCNIGAAAGAGIADHLHYHIVPRWNGDHNFMTVLAEVRAIPEHIEATYDRLLPDFQALLEKHTR